MALVSFALDAVRNISLTRRFRPRHQVGHFGLQLRLDFEATTPEKSLSVSRESAACPSRAIRTGCAARYLECVTRRVAAVSFIDHAFGGDRSPMRVRLSVPAGVWSLSPPGEGRRCEDGAERDDGKKHFHRMFHGSSPDLWHCWVSGARINLGIRECIAFPPRSMNGLTPDKTSLATCESALQAWCYEHMGGQPVGAFRSFDLNRRPDVATLKLSKA
jgi:hypothetical protein